ncbi:MAG TPA: class I SAM-dependent methyltransferase [Solirubrobacteraceae bacterium]
MVRRSPIPDSEAWNRRYAGRELVWTAEPNRFLVQETAPLEPGRALDLACGEGRNAVWLAQREWSVTGVDFSDVALEKARRLAQARGVRAEWVVADLLDYQPAPQAFDLVLIFYLQVPTAQRRPIMRAAAAAVAPGGTLLLVGHDSSNLEHGHGGPQHAAVLYTAQDVVADLKDSGMRIERAERVERPVDTPGGQRIALDALVRARSPAGRGLP